MKTQVLAVIISCSSLLTISSVSAQGSIGPMSIEHCTDYVARTMSQVQMATGCNMLGPQWSQNSAEHMTWCKDASPRVRGQEYDARQAALELCRGDIGAVPIANCNDYASRARSQVELAQALGTHCSFEGMRWSSNLVQHMNWCNRTTQENHEFEDAARRRQLAECNKGSQ